MHKNKLINRSGPSRGWYWSTYSECIEDIPDENRSFNIYHLNFFLKLNELKIKIIREDEYDFKTDKFNNKTVLEKEFRNLLFRVHLYHENHYKSDPKNDKDSLLFLHRMMFRFKGCQKLNSGYKNISFLDDFKDDLKRDYWKTPIIANYPGTSIQKDYDFKQYYKLVESLFMYDYDLKLNDYCPKLILEVTEKIIAPGYIHYHYNFNNYPIKNDIHWTTRSMYEMYEKGDNGQINVITLLTNPSYFKDKLKENENIA